MTATEIVRFVSGLAYEGRLLFASCVNGVVIQDASIAAAASAFLALPYDVKLGVAKTIAQDYGVDLGAKTIETPAPLTEINEQLEIVPVKEEVVEAAPEPKKKAKAKAKAKPAPAKKPVAKKK